MKGKCVLVTGASGFIGEFLCKKLLKERIKVKAIGKRSWRQLDGLDEAYYADSILTDNLDWKSIMDGVETVIHLANIAHRGKTSGPSFHNILYSANVESTVFIAGIAAQYGGRRFIYLSSIKVNGELNVSGPDGKPVPFSESDIPSPSDAYGLSKWKAEQALWGVSKESGLEVVILRPPLVYGPRVKANFLSLIKLVDLGIPLPFLGLKNRRSFINLSNLSDIISKCITNLAVAGHTFLVSDEQDISTPDLIKMIAFAMNKKPVLFYLHPRILNTLCQILGKGEEMEKLTGSLIVDSSKIKNLLGWVPPFTLEEGIKETVNYYKS